MYKLFYNNCSICIRKISNNITTNCNTIRYNDLLSCKDIINDLIEKQISTTIACENDKEMNDLFEKLKDFFIFRRAAGGIVRDKNEILVIQRFNKWDFPKGHIENNETDEVAAIREVKEETNISANIIADLGFFYHIFKANDSQNFILKQTHWFAMVNNGEKTTQPQYEENISQVLWLPIQQLKQLKSNTYLSISELIDKYLNENIVF